MNIQLGRDHGLPSYNQVREDIGLEPVTDFEAISSAPTVQQHLQAVYDTVNDIDLWVGGLAEDHVRGGGLVGETFYIIILKDQFERLRDGYRFWYQHDLSPAWVRVIEGRTLSSIIRDNTSIGTEMEHNVFIVPRTPSHREFPNPGSHQPLSLTAP